jgi:hypothetical protein
MVVKERTTLCVSFPIFAMGNASSKSASII